MLGHGTTITFASGYLAEIVSIERSNVSRESIPTSSFATVSGRTFVPADTYDPGELLVEVYRDPTQTVPINQAAETITLTFPTGAPAETEVFQGFAVEHGYSLRDIEKSTETLRIKASGNIAY
jgi:hypothetical protein